MPLTAKQLMWAGVAKEVTWGTAVTPTHFVPFTDFKPEDAIETVRDQGIRGAMSETYNVIQGTKQSTVSWTADVFPDSIGMFLLAMLGTDTVVGASAPYTHTFKLARTAQPPSLTHTHYNGTNIRQYSGHILDEVTIKFANGAPLEFSCKSTGKPSTTTTGITPTVTTALPLQGWQFAATLGGSATTNVVGFDITFKRKLYTQFAANNSQNVSAIVAGGLEVTGKLTLDKIDDTELLAYLINTQQALELTGIQPGTNHQLKFTLTKCAFTNAVQGSKEVVTLDVDFEGIDNTTDGGAAKVTLINTVATY